MFLIKLFTKNQKKSGKKKGYFSDEVALFVFYIN